MRNIIQLPNLSHLYDSDSGNLVVCEDARTLLNMVLAMAVRDQATSVHFHSHRIGSTTDVVLTYVVGGGRYELVAPPTEIAGELFAAGCVMLAPRGWWGCLRRLVARAVGGCSGQFRVVDADGHSSEWYGVVWSAGPIAGLEFFCRLDSFGPQTEPNEVCKGSESVA